MNNFIITKYRNQFVTFMNLKGDIRIEDANSVSLNIRNSKMKNFILTTLFIMGFAVSAFAAPVANAGSDMTVMVGEAIRC